MKRRTFLLQGSVLTMGLTFRKLLPALPGTESDTALYSLFKNPPAIYRPFVRWWWNGDKIEKEELSRELRLLRDAGIGGVEINPIKFPERTKDLGKQSVPWLSPEWIELLQFTFGEAKSLGMTCDLIVGSGWPFGAEWLEGDERSQVVVIGTKKLEGPLDYEVSLFDLFKEADPAISSPFPGRRTEMLAVKLAPSVINSLEEVVDLSDQVPNGYVHCKIPAGKHVLYALVKIKGFMEVINGAPGANGPVLNHYNEAAVKKYLHRMSDAIQQQTGPLSNHIRSLFADSLELEGSNWSTDMQAEFQKRRGYDIMPWLPFLLFRTGGMGNTFDYDYGAVYSPEFKDDIQRIRYDFELTKAELLKERFLHSFTSWCKENNVLSRAQAYGRGYFPLEGSFDIDLPECETWIKYGLGTEMSETDYRIGRAYTMINKYVSSAAHLKGKRHISCEELTNTDMVFNETLEILKIAGDQSVVSGVTHPVFHGFNYSPPGADFPGWVRYGSFINERNPWWPWFRRFTDYKSRLSAILQQAEMYADIAILLPTADTWSIYGAQNEPFPTLVYPTYQTLIWESVHQNGSGCDYISESVLSDSVMREGYMYYGPRKYHTIFLVEVESMEPATAKKLFEFIAAGGRVFCIGKYPARSPGRDNHLQKDSETTEWIRKSKVFTERFILLDKPEKNFNAWYRNIQQQYKITPYVQIDQPNPFVTQVRYRAKDTEILFFINSHINESYGIKIEPSREISAARQAWIWDAEAGERYQVEMDAGQIELDLGPADSRLVVFDREKKGVAWKKVRNPVEGEWSMVNGEWVMEFRHVDGSVKEASVDRLSDLKEMPGFVNFCGTIIYRINITVEDKSKVNWLDLGKIFGVSELSVNGQHAGTGWYGRREYSIQSLLKNGENRIGIKIVTVMGNYLKTLKDNPVAQYWTNEKRKDQPLQSMGLIGPVRMY